MLMMEITRVRDLETDGKDDLIGLKREEGCALITDSRVMDGFKVRISGPVLNCFLSV